MANDIKADQNVPVTTSTQDKDVPLRHTFPAASSSATFAAVDGPLPPLAPASFTTEAATEDVPPPTAPPEALVPPAPAPKIDPLEHGLVKMNSCALTFAECRAMSGAKGLLNCALIKLTRNQRAAITDLPTVLDIAPFRVETPAIPESGKAKLAELANAFLESGYESPVWYELIDTYNSASFYAGVMPHISGDSFAIIRYRIWNQATPPNHNWNAVVSSALENGGFAYTVADAVTLGAPANYHYALAGKTANVQTLISEHAKLLKRVGKPVRKLLDPESVCKAAEARHAGLARFYLERGLFKTITDEERSLLKSARIDGEHAVHSDVLMEIQRQHGKQNGGSGKLSKLLLLVVSLGLFMYAQKASANWNFLAMLVGVLFFHELGHFIAMKLFGYRDVKMFFIPFLGAAVTGKKVSVAVWKRALVSLAGPVPGVILGIALGAVGLFANKPLFGEIANLLLILNLANLLPILPLDGGHFMEAVLFSRSPLLSVLFRGVGAAGLLGLYFLTHSGVFMTLAIVIAITIPAVYRVAKVAEDLRKEGAVPPDVDQNIPPQIAGLIVARLRAALPAGQTTKTVATFATQVYERIAVPHTSRLACAGLLALYFGTIVIGGAFGSVMYAASQGSLRNIAQWSTSRSEHTVDATRLQAWDGEKSCARKPHVTLVATFKKPTEALQNFNAFKAEAPAMAALRQFGDSLFVLLPAGNETLHSDWLARLESKTKDVFVLKQGDRCMTRLQFVAMGSERAKQIEEDLNVYFAVAEFNIQPPWAAYSRDEQTRSRAHAAQLTFYRATRFDPADYVKDADFTKKLGDAMQRGDNAEVKRLSQAQIDGYRKRHEQKLTELRQQPWVRADVLDAVAENQALMDELSKGKKANAATYETIHKAYRQKLAPMLGAVSADAAAPATNRYGGWGTARHEGVYFDISSIYFEDLATGGPALVNWLQSRGTAITYSIVQREFGGDDDN